MIPERKELADLVKWVHGKGWAAGTGGNFSLLLSREPFRLLMTPSSVDKGGVEPGDLIEVNAAGERLVGEGLPSAETLLHIAIIENSNAEVVLHTHSVWNTLASTTENADAHTIAGYEMLKGLSGVRTHQHFERVPIIDNSQDMPPLAEQFRTQLREDPAIHGILLRGHGLYTWGKDIFEAKRHLEVLEFLFEVTVRSKSMG